MARRRSPSPTLGIRQLYHFTDSRNLESIQVHGILSLKELERLDITPSAYSSSTDSRGIDRYRGLDHYVRLCFWKQHPMEYRARVEQRIEQSVFLVIDPAILLVEGVRIADGIAYAEGTTIYEDVSQAVDVLDWDVITTRTDWRDPEVQRRIRATEKYEVLVPQRVPIDLIRGL